LGALFFSDEKQQRFTQSVIDFDQGNLSFVRVQYPYVKTDRYGLVSSPPCSLFFLFFFSERAYFSPAHCKPINSNDMSLRLPDCPSVRLSSSHLTGRMLYIFCNSCCCQKVCELCTFSALCIAIRLIFDTVHISTNSLKQAMGTKTFCGNPTETLTNIMYYVTAGILGRILDRIPSRAREVILMRYK